MIVSFKHKGLERFFLKGDTRKIKQDHVRKLRLVLAKLHGAQEIRDMNFPSSSLHLLTGDLKDYWSVSVSGNWRLIFQFKNGDASLVDYIDYH
ncbi:MAG: type II toxin-antitoxin system RelE/ParE family toxin [Caedimonas sp.]|nr:type II toxin-antitoxin system RelE/ParE family toxin [Caedimonas sp.]